MNYKHRALLLSISILLLPPVLLFMASVVRVKVKLNDLEHANHEQLLAACRETISNRAAYRNDNKRWGLGYEDKVLILAPLPKEMPLAIRNLHPRDVIITENSVLINVSLPFCRIALIGYKAGARQGGTRRYVDGLWLWTGGTNGR